MKDADGGHHLAVGFQELEEILLVQGDQLGLRNRRNGGGAFAPSDDRHFPEEFATAALTDFHPVGELVQKADSVGRVNAEHGIVVGRGVVNFNVNRQKRRGSAGHVTQGNGCALG